MNTQNRRHFLKQANCAALGSTGVLSSLLNLQMVNSAAGASLPAGNDFRALVCLFLDGGNDAFNTLTPYEVDPFTEYQNVRGPLALSRESLLPITDQDGTRYGLHPSLTEIQELYHSSDLAFLANVGTLRERVEKADIVGQFESALVPTGLFSHSDQAMHWQTSMPETRSSIGWGGRMADLLAPVNQRGTTAMNISLGGINIFQTGNGASPYAVNSRSLPELQDYDSDAIFRSAVDSLLEHEYQNQLRQTYATAMRKAIDTGNLYREALAAVPELTTQFPNSSLGREFRIVARTLAAREALGLRRQTFFVRAGGWDFHDALLSSQANLLRDVSQCVAAFWEALEELGLRNDTLLYSASDFGRSLTANGNGTDHAWGGNHFILGGPVQGGRLYGSYPESLALDSALDIDPGRGRLLPTTSTDEYFAELACWFGVSRADLPMVLPNIRRFYDLTSSASPIGFLSPA